MRGLPFFLLLFSKKKVRCGKKISKYKQGIPLLDELKIFNPDCVRLGLLKQTFGKDFKIPQFEQEEKLRRKVVNCMRYLSSSKVIEKGSKSNKINLGLNYDYDSILKSLTSFRFSQGYDKFRRFIYKRISKEVIERIKLEGISTETKRDVLRLIKNLGEIFTPRSLSNF